MPTRRALVTILTLAFALAGAGLAQAKETGASAEPDKTPPPGSPMAELKKSNADLDKVLKKNVPGWTPEAELQLVQRLVEVELAGQAEAVHRARTVLPQRHLVEIGLEDVVLGYMALQQHRHRRFGQLAHRREHVERRIAAYIRNAM